MTSFQEWILRWIFRQLVRSDGNQARNLRRIYSLVRETCVEAFPEDNAATMDDFLGEQFRTTQVGGKKPPIPVIMYRE